MIVDRVDALRDAHAEVRGVCRDLSDAQWHTASRAQGWRIHDVVAHLAASVHAPFTVGGLRLMRSTDIESTNDWFVDQRRDWTSYRVFGEYERWSARAIVLARLTSGTPLGAVRARLGELGAFRVDRVLTSALVFDHHTHLHYDMAPSLGLVLPAAGANRMAVVVEWMLAVLANQLRAAPSPWLRSPIELTLTGPGGGSWSIESSGAVDTPPEPGAAAVIVGEVQHFPRWATRRSEWRDSDLHISGDVESATKFLDAINIV